MSEQITEQINRKPGDYSSFAPDLLLVTDTAVAGNPVDEASLLVTVCDKLVGGLSGEAKERLTEFLSADITTLRSQHDEDLEPFLALNLTPRFGLRALVNNFDATYKGKFESTYTWEPYWGDDKLGLDTLNKRTIGTPFQPIGQLSLRGAVLTIGNEYEERGLILTNLTTEEQRAAAAGMVLDNQTDWLFKEGMRREAGLPSLDKQTFTRFPQQPEILLDGGSVVGGARSWDGQAALSGSRGGRYPYVGVRRSVGLTL